MGKRSRMLRRVLACLMLLAAVAGIAFTQTPDFRVELQLNVARQDYDNNYLSFIGPIRYISTQRDQFDATTGASKNGSTALFQPYNVDVMNRKAFPAGLRGLFLFAVANDATRVADAFVASRAADGVITINYVHRGTAYQLVTDRQGRLRFDTPGTFKMRTVGFIQGAGPQIISSDFSRDGTAAGIDYARVWDPNVRSNQVIRQGVNTRTGPVAEDKAADDAMFSYTGSLDVILQGDLLRIAGGLNIVGR